MSEGTVLITDTRSGSGFLLDCLKKHPDIETEDLRHWLQLTDGGDPNKKLDYLLSNHFNSGVSVIRVFGGNLVDLTDDFWLLGHKFIYLRRKNVIRLVASSWAKSCSKNKKASPWNWDPEGFVEECDWRMERATYYEEETEHLKSMGVLGLNLYYRDLVGYEGNTATEIPKSTTRKICDFLGLDYQRLWTTRKRNHPWPIREKVSNWDELKSFLENTRYSKWLKEEGVYD